MTPQRTSRTKTAAALQDLMETLEAARRKRPKDRTLSENTALERETEQQRREFYEQALRKRPKNRTKAEAMAVRKPPPNPPRPKLNRGEIRF